DVIDELDENLLTPEEAGLAAAPAAAAPATAPAPAEGEAAPGNGAAPPPAPATTPSNNHRSVAIEEMLEPGQEVLVQVVKEPLGQKGARITSHVSLPGRYLVFMPTVEHVGVSRKITDDDERRRLKTLLKEIRLERGGGGFIVRTWDEVRAVAGRLPAPALLHREPVFVQRLLRDLLSDDVVSIRLDSE